VQTLPGTGGTQTVINAVGELVRAGKRVLVVSARRSTLDGVRHRLSGIGCPAAVSPTQLHRDLIRAIGRNEKAEQPKVADVDDALVRLRTVLRDYRELTGGIRARGLAARGAAHAHHDHARAAAASAETRFDPHARTVDAPRRGGAGAGRPRPVWASSASARRLAVVRRRVRHDAAGPDAHALAGAHRTEVPAILERGYELIAQTRMRPFTTLAELGAYISCCRASGSLDRFSMTGLRAPARRAHPRRTRRAATPPRCRAPSAGA
jgi:hypothetical protein